MGGFIIMNIFTIFSGVVAIAQAIPKIKQIIDMFADYWIDFQIGNIEDEYRSKRVKQDQLLKQIQKASTNEERKILSVILADINKL